MRNTAVQRVLTALCGSLLILMISGCGASKRKSKAAPAVTDARTISYRIIAQPGRGADKMFYSAYLFPAIRMTTKGTPVEKMSQWKGEDGAIKGWNAGSSRSSAMTRRVKQSFSSDGYDLITFPELLEQSQPYSVLVVSTFYTNATPIKAPAEGGPDQTITIKVKGVLFGRDLNPAKSLPVGTVLCTGFYYKDKDDVNVVTSKLLAEAIRNLGDQFEAYGKL